MEKGEQSVQRPPPPHFLPVSLERLWWWWWQKAQLGPCYRSHLMERGLRNSEHQDRYIWSVYPLKCTCATKWRTPGAHWINWSNQPMPTLLCCIMWSFKKRMCVLIFNIEKTFIDLSQHILTVWKQNVQPLKKKKNASVSYIFFSLIFTCSVSKRTFFLPVCQRKLITQAALLSETLLWKRVRWGEKIQFWK